MNSEAVVEPFLNEISIPPHSFGFFGETAG